MDSKYLLFIVKNSEFEGMMPYEIGAQSRLKTLQDGIIRGLMVAGYNLYPAGRPGVKRARIVRNGEEEVITVSVISNEDWIRE